MIKLTFEGNNYPEVVAAVWRFLKDADEDVHDVAPEQAAAPKQDAKPEKPKIDPHKNVAAKADAAERMAKVRAAKAAKKKAPVPEPVPEPAIAQITSEAIRDEIAMRPEKFEDMVLEPDPIDEPEPIDPVNLAALKVKTTEELQAAYSNGKHKQVMALLSKYGNGAKSFRELQIQDFVPIRKAIDEGALA